MDRNIEAKQNRPKNITQNIQLSKDEFEIVGKINELKVRMQQQNLFIKTLMEEKSGILGIKTTKLFQQSIIERTQKGIENIQWIVGDMVFTYKLTKNTDSFKAVKKEIADIIERNDFKIKPITTRIDKAKELEKRMQNEFKEKNIQLTNSLKTRGILNVGNSVEPKQKL